MSGFTALRWAVVPILLLSAQMSDAGGETGPRYDKLVLTDDKAKPVAKEVFTRATPKVFVLATLADVAPQTEVKAVWLAEKTDVAPPNYVIDQTTMKAGGAMNQVTFSYSKPDAGWPVGAYRVDLYLAGTLVKAIRFEIAP